MSHAERSAKNCRAGEPVEVPLYKILTAVSEGPPEFETWNMAWMTEFCSSISWISSPSTYSLASSMNGSLPWSRETGRLLVYSHWAYCVKTFGGKSLRSMGLLASGLHSGFRAFLKNWELALRRVSCMVSVWWPMMMATTGPVRLSRLANALPSTSSTYLGPWVMIAGLAAVEISLAPAILRWSYFSAAV
jgi:hypothetical protein